MKLYVASSWRNQLQPAVVLGLREAGHDTYDFRNPTADNHGFHWSEIDPYWQEWGVIEFARNLEHPIAIDGFQRDMDAMKWADGCVLVLPCGRSAHLEAGWFCGADKPVWILACDGEPELMYKLASGGVFPCVDEILVDIETKGELS